MSAQSVATGHETSFRNARRVNQALTAQMEKRALQWMAERAPRWVSSDKLTLLGLGAQFAGGVLYVLARYIRRANLCGGVAFAVAVGDGVSEDHSDDL